jgi:hypothetical protein
MSGNPSPRHKKEGKGKEKKRRFSADQLNDLGYNHTIFGVVISCKYRALTSGFN